jgi:hypothetical protein
MKIICFLLTCLASLLLVENGYGQFNYSTNGSTITVTLYAGSGGAVTISNFVTEIGTNAFENASNVTCVAMGTNVVSIDQFSFRGCASLTNITIPGSVTNIGTDAFEACSMLTNVDLADGVTSIGLLAFNSCSNLASITLPNSLTNIGGEAFANCALTGIVIPTNFRTIPSFAFYGCQDLTSITFPPGVTNIGSGAFGNCGIFSVTIPSTVTTIGQSAFALCNNLTNIIIPGGVTNIGTQAFQSCENLSSVVVGAGISNLVLGTFWFSPNLKEVLFTGNAPSGISEGFSGQPTVYYLPGKSGWNGNVGFTKALWNPVIQTTGGFGITNNEFSFTAIGTANIPIVIETCTNLADPNWTAIASMTLTNGSVQFSDPQTGNYSQRFYGMGFP